MKPTVMAKHSLAHGVLAEGGADRLGVHGRELHGEGGGAQHEGEVGRLVGAEAGHAHGVADGLGDRGRGLDLVVEDDGHGAPLRGRSSS